MPEFVNTHEQNDNVLITAIALAQLSFTSGAGSGCLRQKARARLLHKLRRGALLRPDTRGRRSAEVSHPKQLPFLFFPPSSFYHMTPIKLKGE